MIHNGRILLSRLNPFGLNQLEHQLIENLNANDLFPRITSTQVMITDNQFLKNIHILHNGVKELEMTFNDKVEEIILPESLEKLTLSFLPKLRVFYFPYNLLHLSLHKIFLGGINFHILKTLESLYIRECEFVGIDHLPKSLISIEFYNNTYINKDKILFLLEEVSKNFTYVVHDLSLISIKAKVEDFLKPSLEAFDIQSWEDYEIEHFLEENENVIVGRCFGQYIFIHKILLSNPDHYNSSNNLFESRFFGFSAASNGYVQNEYIKEILNSKHKFWLFEKEKDNKFTVIKLKDAKSVIGNFIRIYRNRTKQSSHLLNKK
jgi:hypothetical protein